MKQIIRSLEKVWWKNNNRNMFNGMPEARRVWLDGQVVKVASKSLTRSWV